MKKVYEIRGQHLMDISDFLYEPGNVRKRYLTRGFGENFVHNQSEIFNDFIFGRGRILVVAGKLDDICLGKCQNKDLENPCDGPKSRAADMHFAGMFHLKIGDVYSFMQIERNLRDFYFVHHTK